jgi:hypothetical protein
VPKRAVMVHLGEAQVLERHVPQAVERVFGIAGASGNLLKQILDLLFVHVLGE